MPRENTVVDFNRGLFVVLTSPEINLNRSSIALLRCLINEKDPSCGKFREYFLSQFVFESLLFEKFSTEDQESVLNSAFSDFSRFEENREATLVIIERDVLQFYPIFESYSKFDVEAFLDYEKDRGVRNLKCFIAERALMIFKEQMSSISTSPYQAQYFDRIDALVQKAQASMSTKIYGINHDLNVFKRAHLDLHDVAYNHCSHINDSLEDYIRCVSTSIHDQVFTYLKRENMNSDESMDDLARAIFISASENGMSEIIESFADLNYNLESI